MHRCFQFSFRYIHKIIKSPMFIHWSSSIILIFQSVLHMHKIAERMHGKCAVYVKIASFVDIAYERHKKN